MLNTAPLRCTDHDQPEPCEVCAADRQELQAPAPPPPMNSKPVVFTDRDMFVAIRAGLLGIAKAMEGSKDQTSVAVRASALSMSSAIEKRYHIKKK